MPPPSTTAPLSGPLPAGLYRLDLDTGIVRAYEDELPVEDYHDLDVFIPEPLPRHYMELASGFDILTDPAAVRAKKYSRGISVDNARGACGGAGRSGRAGSACSSSRSLRTFACRASLSCISRRISSAEARPRAVPGASPLVLRT